MAEADGAHLAGRARQRGDEHPHPVAPATEQAPAPPPGQTAHLRPNSSALARIRIAIWATREGRRPRSCRHTWAEVVGDTSRRGNVPWLRSTDSVRPGAP